MAKEGRGAVAYLGPSDSGSEIMADFFARVSHPALTDIEFDWGAMSVADVYPSRIPDLFVGRPLVVTGKFLGKAQDVTVSGYSAQQRQSVLVSYDETTESDQAISKIWARLKIADLKDQGAWQADPQNELANAIRSTALEYSLVSDYTSFVAVDASLVTQGEHGVTVNQAVPVPEGVRYDTTVNNDMRD